MATKKTRIPVEFNGLQVNFCKNPQCSNFGVPASNESQKKKGVKRDKYTLNSGGNKRIRLICHECGELIPVKSNKGIVEEKERVSRYLKPLKEPSCPNDACEHHGLGVISHREHFRMVGRTRAGSQRYLCKSCKKTFSVGNATTGQKCPDKNELIFKLLVNKSPLRRICEIAEVHPQTVYNKIDFIYEQCKKFAGAQESKFLDGFQAKRLYLSCDQQEHLLNWTNRADKRNVNLSAIATADNISGYVFGMHLNYDPDQDSRQVEAETTQLGEQSFPAAYRQSARLWLNEDYHRSIKHSRNQFKRNDQSLEDAIDDVYQQAIRRWDIEVSEDQRPDLQLPTQGMQVHSEYTMAGHFMFLKEMLGGVEKLRFFLDQDSGIRAACLSAFTDRIRERTVDAFYVRINKEMTIDMKRQALAKVKEDFSQERSRHPGKSDKEVKLLMIKERLKQMTAHGKWRDRWMSHPFPDMSEPEKAVCHLTDMGDYGIDHLAWLYNKATLHGVDRYFMQVRRRISLLERPITTSSSSRRIWYGYSAYKPETIMKLLEIFRVYYNFVFVGEDKQSPAQRLRIAASPMGIMTVLNAQ